MIRLKIIRVLILVTLVVFIGVLLTSYRKGKDLSGTTSEVDFTKHGQGENLIQSQFSQKNYQKDRLESEITARELINYEDGVNILEDVFFTRESDGLVVKGDFGRHVQQTEETFLWDNVFIQNGEGTTVKTSSALYDQKEGRILGDRRVDIEDHRLTGHSMGVVYDLEDEILQLPADVVFDIFLDESGNTSIGPPGRLETSFLKYSRKERRAFLAGGVYLEYGRYRLTCDTLQLNINIREDGLEHATASGSVLLEMTAAASDGDTREGKGSGSSAIHALAGSPGRKELRTDQLELFFSDTHWNNDEGSRLEYIVARSTGEAPASSLILFPASSGERTRDESENRVYHVSGRRISFQFFRGGSSNRLETFHVEQDCLLKMYPLEAYSPTLPVQRAEDEVLLSGDSITARFDSLSQSLDAVELSGDIHMIRGADHITGELALYAATHGEFTILGNPEGDHPRMWNDDIEAEAVRFVYRLDGSQMEATDDVWVKVSGLGDENESMNVALFRTDGKTDEPIYIQADHLLTDMENDLSLFQGQVRLLNGENMLSAKELEIHHTEKRLEARERVAVVLQPTEPEQLIEETATLVLNETEKNLDETPVESLPEQQVDKMAQYGVSRPAPLEINCNQLVYDDLQRFISLDRNVLIRKDKTTIRGDRMEIELHESENRIHRITAFAREAEEPLFDNSMEAPGSPLTGFDAQRSADQRRRSRKNDAPYTGSSETSGEGTQGSTSGQKKTADGSGAAGRPKIPVVSLTQPSGRTATSEKMIYYPEEEVAVLIGIRKVATILDPQLGSAQGNSLTYHLTDGKIFNRANENEVTLITLNAAASAAEGSENPDDVPDTGSPGRGRESGRDSSGSISDIVPWDRESTR